MIKRTLAALTSLLCAFVSRAEVVINEVHYDPDVKTELVEFIELHNTAATPVSVSNWTISDAVGFTFPVNTSIAANGYLVVCQNPAHFSAKFGKTALGPWIGSLKNEGEEIVLRDENGGVIDRVKYQLGFPWPTVGDAPGSSIELSNPAFDNDLGGNWRPSPTASGPTFKYFKGTQEPSSPVDAWRSIDFVESGEWLPGSMPIGYDPALAASTTLTDWNGSYTTFYIRKTFQIDNPQAIASLQLRASYDDGFKAWINGRLVAYPNMPDTELPYDGIALSTRENNGQETINLPPPSEYLVQGKNVLAIQVANILKSGSSDFFADVQLIGINDVPSGTGPSPGERNRSFTDNLPPAIRQVDNSPNQPLPGEAVTITAKVTDPEGVTSVQLQYQIVDPGNYIELTDPAYATSWTSIAMNDGGTGGDEFAGDATYSAVLPASVQVNRRLVRYRISATDATGKSIVAPYADDPAPNFAYFCYAGVPAWGGAIQPGSVDQVRGAVQVYPESLMRSLPTYHLISKKTSVEDSTWKSQYGGDQYPWTGTLVYEGKVYDHVHYRARGGVWRYAMGKNMWKMDFNRGHDFKPKDNWGREYDVGWTKLNLGACIQQGDFLHRGEQGMFESVGFRLFNLTGLEAPQTHFIQFRVIDEAAETGANQFTGDLWGLYLAVEQEDSRFLQAH
ncbi:MAG TPA: lamin tail domain-containing protein, partial [Verrucomicrobiae bacterium]|nr:lamin tail domain-containing protein [Verrucomicrobiae bacterium]